MQIHVASRTQHLLPTRLCADRAASSGLRRRLTATPTTLSLRVSARSHCWKAAALASCGIHLHSRLRPKGGRSMSAVRLHATGSRTSPSVNYKEETREIELLGAEDASFDTPATYVVFTRAQPEDAETKLAVVDFPEESAFDLKELGQLEEFIAHTKFSGNAGTVEVAKPLGGPAVRVVLVGLGKPEQEPDWQQAGAAAGGAVADLRGGAVRVLLSEDVSVQRFLTGMLPRLHADMRAKGTATKEDDREAVGPESIAFVACTEDVKAGIEKFDKQVEDAKALSSSVSFARELVNTTANFLTPESMASAAKDLAARFSGCMKVKILEKKECEKMGMGCYLGVAACSDLPPKFIHLTYTPPGEVRRKIGVIGKGLTFDSGGYNIKAGAGSMIEMMKFDMGGAASTLGTAAAVAQLKPEDVEVHFIIASCENMVSGNPGSLHPGDILTAMDGTTVEVNNTDAEGRLTLADAMLYCQDQGVEEMVELSTLTGACMVALGQEIAGMWSNNDDLAERLKAAAKASGEKVWQMPLEDGYTEGLKSDLADTKNSGPRFGGAITAALFLKKFVKKDLPWIHLDIAGPAWADKSKGLYPAGGTGTMVRTLTHMLVSGSKA